MKKKNLNLNLVTTLSGTSSHKAANRKEKVTLLAVIVQNYFLRHNWEPCSPTFIIYQHHKSLVLQHEKRANRMANMKLSLDTRITRTKALLEILQQPKKHMEGGWAGQVRQWWKAAKTTKDPLHTQTHTPSRVWEKHFPQICYNKVFNAVNSLVSDHL